MKIGILGSGMVGQDLGAKLVELGHDVVIGTRDPAKLDDKKSGGASLREWLARTSGKGRVATFAAAAAHGELVVHAAHGAAAFEVLKAAGGAKNLDGKVVIDTANDLDFSAGMPPRLVTQDGDSLGERIQKAYPKAKVVKTLNTVTSAVMIDPAAIAGGDHHVFLSGNDKAAKAKVAEILASFGWRNVLDLGDITTARGSELLLPLWLRLWGALGTPLLNLKVVR